MYRNFSPVSNNGKSLYNYFTEIDSSGFSGLLSTSNNSIQSCFNTLDSWTSSGYIPLYSITSNNIKSSLLSDLHIYTGTSTKGILIDSADGHINIESNTVSSSYSTGALVVSGGVGINGDLYISGDLHIPSGTILEYNEAREFLTDITNFDGILSSADSTIQKALDTIDDFGKTGEILTSLTLPKIISTTGSDLTISTSSLNPAITVDELTGDVSLYSSTVATSKTAASLILSGGLACSDGIYATYVNLSNYLQTSAQIFANYSAGDSYTLNLNSIYTTGGISCVKNITSSGKYRTPSGTDLILNCESFGDVLTCDEIDGHISLPSTVASSNYGTGALVVAGGVGINGDVRASGAFFAGSATTEYAEGEINTNLGLDLNLNSSDTASEKFNIYAGSTPSLLLSLDLDSSQLTADISNSSTINIDSSGFSSNLSSSENTLMKCLNVLDGLTLSRNLGSNIFTIGTGCDYSNISDAISANSSYTIENIFLICEDLTETITLTNDTCIKGLHKNIILTGKLTLATSSKTLIVEDLTISGSTSNIVISNANCVLRNLVLNSSGAGSDSAGCYFGVIQNYAYVENCTITNSHALANVCYNVYLDQSTSSNKPLIEFTNNKFVRTCSADVQTKHDFIQFGNTGNVYKEILFKSNSFYYFGASTTATGLFNILKLIHETDDDYIQLIYINNSVSIRPGTTQSNAFVVLNNNDSNSATNHFILTGNVFNINNFTNLTLFSTTTGSRASRLNFTNNIISTDCANFSTGLSNFSNYIFDSVYNYGKLLYSTSNIIETSGLKIEDSAQFEIEASTKIILDSPIIEGPQIPEDSTTSCDSTLRFNTTSKQIYYVTD